MPIKTVVLSRVVVQPSPNLPGWAKPSRRYLIIQTGRLARLCGRLSDRTPAGLAFLCANAPERYRYVLVYRSPKPSWPLEGNLPDAQKRKEGTLPPQERASCGNPPKHLSQE
jgi:hypothetical protein